MKLLRHWDLPHYLELTSTFKQMGLVPAANFPSAPKPCRPRLSSPVFQPNHRLHLVRRLGTLRPSSSSNPHSSAPMRFVNMSNQESNTAQHWLIMACIFLPGQSILPLLGHTRRQNRYHWCLALPCQIIMYLKNEVWQFQNLIFRNFNKLRNKYMQQNYLILCRAHF